MDKGVILLLISVFAYIRVQAQTGIGTRSPDANAVLEIKSTNKGLLIPRITLQATDDFSPLSDHVEGMIVYNTVTSGTTPSDVAPGFYYNDGTKWIRIGDAAAGDKTKDAWVDDNANTMVKLGTQSDGSTSRDAGTGLVIKDDGKVGAGTIMPTSKLTVIGGTGAEVGFIVSDNEANNTDKYSYIKSLAYNTSNPPALLLAGTVRNSGTTVQLGGVSENHASAQQIQFFTDTDNNPSTVGATRRMEILNDGKVGIGTTGEPQATLHVNGSTQITGELKVGGTINTPGNPGTTGQVLFSEGAATAPIWNKTTTISGISRIVVNNEGASTQTFSAPSGAGSSGNIVIDLNTEKFNNKHIGFFFRCR